MRSTNINTSLQPKRYTASLCLALIIFFATLISGASARLPSSDSSDDEDSGDESGDNAAQRQTPSQYMYGDEYEPYVIDYHVGPFDDSEGREESVMAYYAGADANTAKRRDEYEYKKIHPDFVFNSTDGAARVVEFYTPWCPHCQQYKHHYVDMARQVQSLPGGADVKFYAISCTVHRPLCKLLGIRRYPAVLGFKPGSTEGEQWMRSDVTPRFILKKLLGISETGGKRKPTPPESVIKEEPTISRADIKRTKANIYSDAFLSFDFNLRNEIYMDDGPLSDEAATALRDWINLLYKTMPVSFRGMHRMLRALRDEFDDVVEDEDYLFEILQEKDVRPKKRYWSEACSLGKKMGGYTCGLWQLFHIMAIGVAEWNMSDTVSPSARIGMAYAARTLRSFVEEFFGCEVCQDHFIEAFDSCAHDRCTRLTDDVITASDADFKELSLYLWEFHNSVNVRLLNEKAEHYGRPLPSKEKEEEVRWPSRDECSTCWLDDGSWDKGAVYDFLKAEYWAETDFVHDEEESNQDGLWKKYKTESTLPEGDDLASNNIFSFILIPVSAVGLYAILLRWEKDRLGKQKKYDSPVSRAGNYYYR